MPHTLSKHAEKRMNQRGLRKEDLTLLLEIGEQVAPDAYLVTNEIANRLRAQLRQALQQIDRLQGKTLIVEGETIVTGYHAGRDDQKRKFRKGRAFA